MRRLFITVHVSIHIMHMDFIPGMTSIEKKNCTHFLLVLGTHFCAKLLFPLRFVCDVGRVGGGSRLHRFIVFCSRFSAPPRMTIFSGGIIQFYYENSENNRNHAKSRSSRGCAYCLLCEGYDVSRTSVHTKIDSHITSDIFYAVSFRLYNVISCVCSNSNKRAHKTTDQCAPPFCPLSQSPPNNKRNTKSCCVVTDRKYVSTGLVPSRQ